MVRFFYLRIAKDERYTQKIKSKGGWRFAVDCRRRAVVATNEAIFAQADQLCRSAKQIGNTNRQSIPLRLNFEQLSNIYAGSAAMQAGDAQFRDCFVPRNDGIVKGRVGLRYRKCPA
jgi:hypothetical protein